MKKVLVVGNGKHYFNQKLYTKLKNAGIEVDFFSYLNLNSDDISTYKKTQIVNIFDKKIPHIFNFRGGKGFYADQYLKRELKQVINNNDYEIIHLQGATLWGLSAIQKSSAKKILSVWGSDIYRVNSIKLLLLKKLVKKINTITFSSSNTRNYFNANIYSHNDCRLVRFGLDLIEVIKEEKFSFKKNKDKVVVTIGYNRDKAQQHLAVLKSLQTLPESITSKIEIIIPFTYGTVDLAYKKTLIDVLDQMGVQYSFVDNFLSEKNLALIRLNTDIMVQVQITDQFSGSMQEHLYAGNIIITGTWLEYSDLVNQGAVYEKINDIEEIATKTEEVISNLDKYKQLCKGNSEVIRAISSWDNNLSKWENLYN